MRCCPYLYSLLQTPRDAVCPARALPLVRRRFFVHARRFGDPASMYGQWKSASLPELSVFPVGREVSQAERPELRPQNSEREKFHVRQELYCPRAPRAGAQVALPLEESLRCRLRAKMPEPQVRPGSVWVTRCRRILQLHLLEVSVARHLFAQRQQAVPPPARPVSLHL